MTQEQFLNLVRRGEKSTVDFKLVCNAFNTSAGDCDKAKAELVKDICAMANNASSTSYLIVGVGDDRKTVQSVIDPNLSSQNIQSLIRDSIHPRPIVRVHRLNWSAAPKPFGGIQFVVIQVGPNARHAFRLTRDMINFAKKFHFRKHEVWVRNEDTSDLATPEQIARLLGIRHAAQAEPEPDFRIIEYQKLALADQLDALGRDVKRIFGEMGCKFASAPIDGSFLTSWKKARFRVCVRIRRKPFVFRCEFRPRLASKDERFFTMDDCWMCEHGVIVFVINSFTESGKLRGLSVDSKTEWGSFGIVNPRHNAALQDEVPGDFAAQFGYMTLSNLSDTRKLRDKVGRLLSHIESDDLLFDHLDHARCSINKELRRWRGKSLASYRHEETVASNFEPTSFRQQARSVSKLAESLS